MGIDQFIKGFSSQFPLESSFDPWEIVERLEHIVLSKMVELDGDFIIENNIAIHKTAVIEQGVVLKGAMIISQNCSIGANAYLRGPLFFGSSVRIGPSSEIKQSMVFDNTAIAHFNYVGNSILGHQVNLEAGSICANHYNERLDKRVYVLWGGKIIDTGRDKIGSLIGDDSKIGANAVLSPGTVLEKRSVVKRLELVEQIKEF
jgi:UDP-N-acetylglucosamine diphosphorylase / glucose-1-phosphate thymidylyltransferase / UDP-N-acetylgalactosamine diphosphorylase / glucosamine-1-phosphate N-acetyltransferase / galactosamine-1-phosphate N-acetyltransferase